MRRCILVAWVVLSGLTGPGPERASQSGKLPAADNVVEIKTYVSRAPVPRGSAFEVAVVAKVLPKFHVNANKVLQDYLIPTELEFDLPKGFQLIALHYPQGKLKKFSFSPERLNVYEGRFKLRMKVRAEKDAPLGKQTWGFSLRYQACNDELCLPPVRIPVLVELETALVDAKSKSLYPGIFQERYPPPVTRPREP